MANAVSPPRDVLQGLQKSSSKQIPFFLLYDARGSELYDQIVELEEYYPYAAESRLLEEYAPRIARSVPPDCVLVELGCGTALKTRIILTALNASHGGGSYRDGLATHRLNVLSELCQYVGIDVSERSLKQARTNLIEGVPGLKPASISFIQADFMEGLKRVKRTFPNKVMCVMWLGSSIGNLTAEDASSFLKEVLAITGQRCVLLICTDMWKEANVLYKAYHDDKGVTEAFIKNGMKNALSLLGHASGNSEMNSWLYHVQINSKLRRVEMWVTFPKGLSIEKHHVYIRPGESVLVEFSRKFTLQDVQELATRSSLYIQSAWRTPLYGCQILYSGSEALRSCWDCTDEIFDSIPDWESKPIDLRHPFLFYYGHVNAFTKLKLFDKMEAEEMDIMFSRGIDPSVLDPSECHQHPPAPTEWPSQDRICAYVKQVRSMVINAILDGVIPMRLICLVLEHERMHQETLIYMVTQQRKADFERTFSAKASSKGGLHLTMNEQKEVDKLDDSGVGCRTQKIRISQGKISMGSQQSESVFLWDNEMPLVETFVSHAFMVSAYPVSIAEYMEFIKDGGYDQRQLWERADFLHFKEKGYKWPATWSFIGEFYVHDHSSTKHWKAVANEAVYVSLAEAEAYCLWAGDFRVMTEEEYHRALSEDGKTVHALREAGWEWTSTPFKGFPGFVAMSEYEEYSADFFDGKHFVLKGSSPATHPALIRDSFRNFYQRQYRYVFAKFRCCKTLANARLARADSNGGNSNYRSAVFGHV